MSGGGDGGEEDTRSTMEEIQFSAVDDDNLEFWGEDHFKISF